MDTVENWTIENWIDVLRRSERLDTDDVLFQWNLLSNRAGYRNFGCVISEARRKECDFDRNTYFTAFQKCSKLLWGKEDVSAFVGGHYMYVVVHSDSNIDDYTIYSIIKDTLKCECDGQLVDNTILNADQGTAVKNVLKLRVISRLLFFRFRMVLIQDLPFDSFGSRLLSKGILDSSKPALLSDLQRAFPFEIGVGIGDFVLDPTTNWWISIQMQKYHLQRDAQSAFVRLTSKISNELSGDSVEEKSWEACFSLLVGEDIKRAKASRSKHDEQKESRKARVRKIQFDNGNMKCCLCGGTFAYGKFEEGHIVPAAWGNKKDKYWWNMMPLHSSCNKRQSTVSANLIVALQKKRKINVARRICLKLMKECLRIKNVISLGVVGTKTLIGFVRGFFLVAEEDFVPINDWNEFLLSEDEITKISELIDCKTFEI